MPKAIRRSRGRQVKVLPGAAVRVTIPAGPTPGPAGLDTTGMRRSNNVEVRPANANPLERRINISDRPAPRRRRPTGVSEGTRVGQRANPPNWTRPESQTR